MRILSRGGGNSPPIVIAHRGASRRALENSLEAFSLSLADRADMIEFDVRLSADGEPVVIHDDRT
ncbi:MAG: glycerophosphodiester phosphodiesterase, partial [Thermodesulfobacteriota bacterium]|nr:glycerophosphodiester phosphodiesterase [Thermodesulfobacteriota bacterium]